MVVKMELMIMLLGTFDFDIIVRTGFVSMMLEYDSSLNYIAPWNIQVTVSYLIDSDEKCEIVLCFTHLSKTVLF